MDDNKLESIIFCLKETIAEKDKEIERLQGESADLNVKNATLEHENSELKQRVSILEADNDDYKNKIAEGELVSIDWHYSQVEDLEEEKMRLGNRLSETQYSLSVCQDVNAEQKAEIERLNSKYKNLEINYNSVWEDYRKYEVENAEQKAEIERLKDENIEERDIHFKNLCGYKNRIAELERQVDELKSENTELYKEHTALIAGSLLEKQNTVKDTAKEIFEKIFEVLCCFTTQGKSREYTEGFVDCLEEVDKRLQNLAKERYGAEVE